MSAEIRFNNLGLTLPPVSAPVGNYTSAVQVGNLMYISGKAPSPVDGVMSKGKLGQRYSTADGVGFAHSACLEVLAVLKEKLGSLDKVVQVVDLHGSINAVPEFEQHAEVLDGASDLLSAVFGPAGAHVRSVIGVSSLRNGVPLTIKVIVEVRE